MFSEQIRCVAHSLVIVAMTMALLVSMGTCFVRIQSVWVKFACIKRLSNISAEAIIKVRNKRLCARCAMFFLKIKQIPFSYRSAMGFIFLERVKSQLKI